MPLSLRRLTAAGLVLVSCLCLSLHYGSAQDEPKVDRGRQEAMDRVLRKAEDEYRLFFKRPEAPLDFWAAISYEVDVGKYDIAAMHLERLLKKDPPEETDKALLRIEEAKGMAPFLRLRDVRKWSDNPDLQREAEANVESLLSRITTALEKSLADPDRIKKFIGNLNSPLPQERSYAFVQLKRSGERASPYLVDALRGNAGTAQHHRLMDYILQMGPEVLPPMFEVLRAHDNKDARDTDLRYSILEIMRRKGEARVVPYLWHLSESPMYPALVRTKARQTLAELLETTPEKLPRAKEALTQLAEQYYQHRIKFTDPKAVRVKAGDRPGQDVVSPGIRVWAWDGEQVSREPVTLSAREAERFFGLRYGSEALDLDPAYRPAQQVYLSLALERTFDENLDQVLLKKTPDKLHQMLSTVDASLLLTTLERALGDRNIAVILPLVRTLGERGDTRAALAATGTAPRGVVRALYYPDRRVQFTGARAMLHMPAAGAPVEADRVVDVLRRFLAAPPVSKAVLAFVPPDKAVGVRQGVKAAGFEPVLVGKTKELFEELDRAADVDVIFLHGAAPAQELPYVLSQLRADRNVGLLPVVLLSTPDTRDALERTARRHLNVWVLPEGMLTMPEELKGRLDEYLKLAQAPAVVGQLPGSVRTRVENDIKKIEGQKLSGAERKRFAAEALDMIWRMARGEVHGYDLRPLQATLVEAMRSEESAVQAIEVLGTFPGLETQQRLAAVVLDPGRGKLRMTAALELNRHIQKNGLMLNKLQLDAVKTAVNNPKEDEGLRQQLAILYGNVTPSPRLTGIRLQTYVPPVGPAAPPKEEEKKGAEEKKGD